MSEQISPIRVLKVGAFIVRRDSADRWSLLLFTHPDYPEAPIQIPGGNVDPGEDIDTALWREVAEETGLTGLILRRKLGVSEVVSIVNPEETLVRHCFLLEAPPETPDTWIHRVSGSGIDLGLRFSYAWNRIEPDFRLSGDLGHFLTPEHLPELYAVSCTDQTHATCH